MKFHKKVISPHFKLKCNLHYISLLGMPLIVYAIKLNLKNAQFTSHLII